MRRCANIASNLAYVAAAIAVDSIYLSLALLVLAAGSAAYHAKATRWTLAADRFGMTLVFSALLFTGPWYGFVFIAAVSAFLAYKREAATPIVTVLGAVAVAQAGIDGLIALIILACAYGLWMLEPVRSDTDGFPHHASWHVLTALAIWVLA